MVRNQLPMAFQGLVVVPLFAGYDEEQETGRVFTYDVVGGRYEEQDFGATGSGSKEAKAFLRTGSTGPTYLRTKRSNIGMGALVAAAQEDTATGGPDLHRGILPNVVDRDLRRLPRRRPGAGARRGGAGADDHSVMP